MKKPKRVGFYYFLTTAIIAIAFMACLGCAGIDIVFASEEAGDPSNEEQEIFAAGYDQNDQNDQNAPVDSTGQDMSRDQSDPVVLRVYMDETEKMTFSLSELEALGTETHSYSAFNAFPSPQRITDVTGVRLTSILQAAGIDIASIGNNQVIEVVASDNVSESFLKGQLFATRYYFPNVMKEAGRQGKAPLAVSWTGKTAVPAMISLADSEGDSDNIGRFVFGQISPTEQNFSAFLKYVLESDPQSGKLIVHSETAGRWTALRKTSPASGGFLKQGTVITLDRSVNNDPVMLSDRYCIYYTTNGSEPTLSSAIYNYNNYNFGNRYEKFNKPVISKEGAVTIKTKVIGYGMQDSTTTTFRYTGYRIPATPKITSIKAKKKKKSITLKWTKARDAQGYKIYRAKKKNGKYTLVKTISKGGTLSWTNKKLKKKKTYYYKIRSYRTVSGKTFYSGYSPVKYKKVK